MFGRVRESPAPSRGCQSYAPSLHVFVWPRRAGVPTTHHHGVDLCEALGYTPGSRIRGSTFEGRTGRSACRRGRTPPVGGPISVTTAATPTTCAPSMRWQGSWRGSVRAGAPGCRGGHFHLLRLISRVTVTWRQERRARTTASRRRSSSTTCGRSSRLLGHPATRAASRSSRRGESSSRSGVRRRQELRRLVAEPVASRGRRS